MPRKREILEPICWILAAAVMAAPAFAQQQTARILAIGDSLTAGYGLAEDDSYPSQLQRTLAALGYSVEVENAGISGDTTTGVLNRLDWILQDAPDAAIVAIGANDAFRAVSVDLVHANLSEILEKLQTRNIPVLLCGFKAPRNLGHEYVQAFDQVYEDLARKFDVEFYPHFLEGVATVADLNLSDGIHPNAEGVARIVKGIINEVRKLLLRVDNANKQANRPPPSEFAWHKSF